MIPNNLPFVVVATIQQSGTMFGKYFDLTYNDYSRSLFIKLGEDREKETVFVVSGKYDEDFKSFKGSVRRELKDRASGSYETYTYAVELSFNNDTAAALSNGIVYTQHFLAAHCGMVGVDGNVANVENTTTFCLSGDDSGIFKLKVDDLPSISIDDLYRASQTYDANEHRAEEV